MSDVLPAGAPQNRQPASAERTLYCALVPLSVVPGDKRALLLPNAVIAETFSYDRIEPLPDAPQAVIGCVRYEGRSLPVLSIEALRGAPSTPSSRSRVVILHPLTIAEADMSGPEQSAFALLASGYPHLVAVTPALLAECALQDEDIACAALARVRIGHTEALIPDLDRLHALAHGVPEPIPDTGPEITPALAVL
jgi:chemosensory pili system protein ChpC